MTDAKPSSRRYRTAEQTRERILDAATELFAHRTPNTVSLREIADAAGLQHSLIVRYFGSKDQLVAKVIERTTAGYADAVLEASDPAEGFVAAFHHLLSHPAGALALASAQIAGSPGAEKQTSYPGVALHLALLADAAGPEARDPRILTVVAIALIGGWTLLENWARLAAGIDDLTVDEVRIEVADILRSLIENEADLRSP